MKKIWPLAVLGIVSYLVFAIATLPAQFLVSRLAPAVMAAGVQGTVWNGQAQVVQAGATQLGSLSWTLHALPLFTGRLAADVKITRSDGFIQGRISSGFSGNMTLNDVTASLPLSALPPNATPGGWTGTVNARLATLTLVDGWPTSADGTIQVADLTGPARRPLNMGGYKITFPPGTSGDELVGALGDTGGPLDIAGNVRLKSDRSYLIEGAVATRPEAPKSVADSLQYLGAPDAQGRRPFSIQGTM